MKPSLILAAFLFTTSSMAWKLNLYGYKKKVKAHGGYLDTNECYNVLRDSAMSI
jgi:hypothetical protein